MTNPKATKLPKPAPGFLPRGLGKGLGWLEGIRWTEWVKEKGSARVGVVGARGGQGLVSQMGQD